MSFRAWPVFVLMSYYQKGESIGWKDSDTWASREEMPSDPNSKQIQKMQGQLERQQGTLRKRDSTGKTPCQQGQCSGRLGTGWGWCGSSWLWGNGQLRMESPSGFNSCLSSRNCGRHEGQSSRDITELGPPGNESVSYLITLGFYYYIVVKVLLGGKLIANYYLEENGYFIFLLSSVPHSLLSPVFNFLGVYLKDKNYMQIGRYFFPSTLWSNLWQICTIYYVNG